jgi:hypothetical protein
MQDRMHSGWTICGKFALMGAHKIIGATKQVTTPYFGLLCGLLLIQHWNCVEIPDSQFRFTYTSKHMYTFPILDRFKFSKSYKTHV